MPIDMAAYMRNRRKTRRDNFIAALGGACEECGSTDRLEFHHPNRNTMKFRISGSALDKPIEVIAAEVAVCVLLCHDCHMVCTREQHASGQIVPVNKNLTPRLHGTARMYTEENCRCVDCKIAKRLYRDKKINYTQLYK